MLLVVSHYGPPPRPFGGAIARGAIVPVKQVELEDADLERAAGVITTMHLDQVDFARRCEAITRFLDRGGRLAFMGHLVRPFLPALSAFIPLATGRRSDFALCRLGEHPIFDGIARESLEERRGVAGFYGRGHVPMPAGAAALTGLGPARVPVDWIWDRPEGGAILLHAGNDLWGATDDKHVNQLFAERLVEWAAGRLPVIASEREAAS